LGYTCKSGSDTSDRLLEVSQGPKRSFRRHSLDSKDERVEFKSRYSEIVRNINLVEASP
jgi:hypothetical protein